MSVHAPAAADQLGGSSEYLLSGFGTESGPWTHSPGTLFKPLVSCEVQEDLASLVPEYLQSQATSKTNPIAVHSTNDPALLHIPQAHHSLFLMSLATEGFAHQGQHTLYRRTSFQSPATFSPWDTLPTEIIARIFGIVVELDPDPQTARFLSQTCSLWRSIAVNTHLFWQHIIIRQMDTECHWAKICVSRCSSRAIDFTIPPSMHLTAGRVSKLLDIIDSCVGQLRRVTIHIDHMAAHRFVEWFAQCNQASNLEALSISTPHYTEYEVEVEVEPHAVADWHLQAPMNVAPQLPSFVPSPINEALDGCSFTRLKHLEIGNQTYENKPNLHHIISIISRCPDLETLILQGPGGSISQDDMNLYPNPITFPSLTHLEISHQTSPEQVIFLGNLIRAPSLQSLVLAEWIVAAFNEAIEYFGVQELYRTVTSLRICGINVSTIDFGVPAFMGLFEGMPDVNHLTIELHGMNPIALSCLSTEHPDVPAHLPLLRSLKVPGSHRHCVAEMVTKRAKLGLRIEDLYLQKKCDQELPHVLETITNAVTNVHFTEEWESESTCTNSDYGSDSEEGESGETESDSFQDTDDSE